MDETKPLIGAGSTIAFQADQHPTTATTRKRPLRTYGRRTTAAAQHAEAIIPSPKSEAPMADHAILSPIPKQGDDPDTIVVAVDDFESLTPRELGEGSSRRNRNSILSYFKPVTALPPSPSTLSDNERESDSINQEPSSPPPSPRPTQIRRKRRRLTTRPDIIHMVDLTEETRPPSDQEGDARLKENKKTKLQDISPKGAHGAPFIAVTTPPEILLQRNIANSSSSSSSNDSDEQELDFKDEYRLRQASGSHLNQPEHTSHPEEAKIPRGEHSSSGGDGQRNSNTKNKKKKPKELVQTTLSMAINPGPGFTICKDCGILYNHLNENDRKEHKRRHAAHVRSKTKRGL